jgi:GntR family transcriptional regulator/MocR family aminotransferase
VPSSRDPAAELGLSRFPVLHAYAQLTAEWYFETRIGSGTLIAHSIPDRFTLPPRSDDIVAGYYLTIPDESTATI